MSRLALLLVLCAATAGGGVQPAGAAISGSWVGSYRLPAAAQPVAFTIDLRSKSATVALGPGHSFATKVAAVITGSRLRFKLPGRPTSLVFAGTLKGRLLSGTVSQGRVRGSFRLKRGSSPAVSALGLYRSSEGATVGVIQAQGLPTWLVELPDGTTHGLNTALTTVGTRLGDTSGDGTLAVAADALTWTRGGAVTRYDRLRLHQQEVQIGRLAATLTIPDGRGPFPAAVLVHGSTPAGREEFQTFAAYLGSIGIAVLAADKRGVGQSGGAFPGTKATESTISLLAADAQAQVLFLDKLPQIDKTRVGLLGPSQAGWVIALAAAREPAVRWAVPLVGPTTTVEETDFFTQLAGAEQREPSGTRAQMLGQVRAQGLGGFDPVPPLRKLSIPVFWIYGDDDRNVPTELCVERLQAIKPEHDFTWIVLHMTHALIDLPSGLYSSLPQSRGFTAGLFLTIGDWLRSRNIAR